MELDMQQLLVFLHSTEIQLNLKEAKRDLKLFLNDIEMETLKT